MKSLLDRHGRTKRKLRLSLTDRCNFRCRYCMPEQPKWLPRNDLLNNDELLRLARLFVEQGITQFRLTGGEPLLRTDLEEVVAQLSLLREHGLERISLTSNGTLLAKRAQALVDAGINDFNISLDALDESVFTRLTKADIHPVLAGIEAAQATGVSVKINTVLVRGYNEDQVLPLLEWAMAKNLSLRFIEYMPLDEPGRWQRQSVVDEDDVLAQLRSRHRVEKMARSSDPASPYLVDGHYQLGIISTVSHPFCASCDRLRLTAKGELYTCLFAATGTALGEPLRQGASDEQLQQVIAQAVWNKQAGYAAAPEPVERPVRMYAMGG